MKDEEIKSNVEGSNSEGGDDSISEFIKESSERVKKDLSMWRSGKLLPRVVEKGDVQLEVDDKGRPVPSEIPRAFMPGGKKGIWSYLATWIWLWVSRRFASLTGKGILQARYLLHQKSVLRASIFNRSWKGFKSSRAALVSFDLKGKESPEYVEWYKEIGGSHRYVAVNHLFFEQEPNPHSSALNFDFEWDEEGNLIDYSSIKADQDTEDKHE